MASWIISSFAFCILATVCFGIEHVEEVQFTPEVGLGEELLEKHELLHHEHKPTSYQNFHLESKNPVPVVVKKEHHHIQDHEVDFDHHETLSEHQFEEPVEFKGL